MSFLAPALLLGLLAAALPWLVHLIGKRRAVPVRFAAMQLLMRSEKRVSARRRLREILLLLARTAIAASLPFIFSRPFTERAADLPDVSFTTQSAVIVLDDSASMRRSAGSGSMFEAARDKARAIIQQLPSDSDMALLFTCGNATNPVAELTTEKARMLETLENAQPSVRPGEFTEVMRRATLVLAASLRAERRIFLITDLQAAGWGDDPGVPPASAPDVQILDVSADRPWINRAVLDVTVEPAAESGVGGVTVTAEIADFSAAGVTNLGVTLKVDGAVLAKTLVDLAPGSRTKQRWNTLVPDGSHDAQVEIDADDFALDDRRLARIELGRRLRALVINGDARTMQKDDEVYFLETALRSGDGGASVTTMLPDDVVVDSLANYNVVFLANVAEPSPALAAALAAFVEAGGGLFLSVGNHVEPQVWNDRLAKVLPQPLAVARTASALPGQTQGETVDTRPAERLAPLDRRHPLLANYPPEGEGLAKVRFFKLMLLDPVPDSVGRSVVMRFENGAPALVERQVGKGRVLLLATSIDRDWTDLPIHPGFLPLMVEAARRLTGAGEDGGVATLTAGQPRQIEVGADVRRLEVVKPDGAIWVSQHDRGAGTRTIIFTDTDQLGAYRVRTVGFNGAATPRSADGFVVNLDPRESDPARLPPDRRPDSGTKKALATGQAPRRRVELWHGLAGLVIAVVLLESLLTLRWRRTVVAQRG